MKTITLREAFEILENAAAVIIDDTVTYPTLYDLIESDENEFLHIGWEVDDLGYTAIFQEGDNQFVKVSGSSLFMVDDRGEETQVSILIPANLA